MKDEASELGGQLKEKYGDKVEFMFVDTSSDKIKDYPNIRKILDKVRLPLTVINGQPRFHGGLSPEVINQSIDDIL
ncbi:MAG: hypothetical protein WC364_05040 [Eubacteriales bacterium]|jgi:hypothetical protein